MNNTEFRLQLRTELGEFLSSHGSTNQEIINAAKDMARGLELLRAEVNRLRELAFPKAPPEPKKPAGITEWIVEVFNTTDAELETMSALVAVMEMNKYRHDAARIARWFNDRYDQPENENGVS